MKTSRKAYWIKVVWLYSNTVYLCIVVMSLCNHFTVRGQVMRLQKEVTDHLNDGRRGERLRSGVHVAIVGAPNAGKSSLLNILCKSKCSV